ncbi:hypothetical protein ThidrDRAFT_2429 [Thiorhodococcus drewsii AZ1]|uniref:Uncharacterized protein n=1 Tax=Thiorhodococcus drewsii AZ1 TaxID=765913 RepID=G2E2J7_9GAMM|nr:hypothetical protein [Thiorhodococcus drewsii]EGV30797.1 hypothetical protein ThidrDRAFT_2429 [Thiorhodococcus drewsii AZ1]
MKTFLSRALIVGGIAMIGLAANSHAATTDAIQAGSATTFMQEAAGLMTYAPR